MASIDQIQIPSGSSSATYDIDAKTVNGKTVESNVPPSAKFTDTKVVQTPTTANGDYRVIFSGTADDTSHTEQVRKNGDFTYNPDSTELKITKSFSSGGVTGTRTTTHAGYGLDIEEYVGSSLWSKLGLRSGDITLTNKTWDGTNASLATAISAIKQSLVNYVIRYITWNSSPSSYQNGAYYYHTYNSDISKSNYDIVSIYVKNSKWKIPLFATEEDDDTSTTYKIRLEYAKSDFPNVNDLASNDRQWIVIGYIPKKFN